MVKSLERLAGAVRFLSGYAAGSLLLVSRGGGVTSLPILVSLAVSLSVSLALGQRAERPLLPHPFHAACMLGTQLPPLQHRRSPQTLATGLFHSFLPLWLCLLPCADFSLPNSELLPVTPSTWRKRDEESKQGAQITLIHLLHLQKHTLIPFSLPHPHCYLPTPETSPVNSCHT